MGCAASVVFLIITSHAFAEAVGPREIVRQYCAWDAQGERDSERLWALYDDAVEQHEPGWDAVGIIAGYAVGSAQMRGNRAHVPVVFHQVGTFADGFHEKPGEVRTTFQLIRRGGGWKIQRYATMPMVYPEQIVAGFRSMARWYNPTFEKARDRRLVREAERAVKAVKQFKLDKGARSM